MFIVPKFKDDKVKMTQHFPANTMAYLREHYSGLQVSFLDISLCTTYLYFFSSFQFHIKDIMLWKCFLV